MAIDIHDQIKEAQRELNTRKNVYPKWIQYNKIPSHIAQKRIQAMEAIINTLIDYEKRTRTTEQLNLWSNKSNG